LKIARVLVRVDHVASFGIHAHNIASASFILASHFVSVYELHGAAGPAEVAWCRSAPQRFGRSLTLQM
jgi:hypothetical protein